MESGQLNSAGAGDIGMAELNHHMRYEHKEVRDGVVGEGQGLSEEDESRINEIAQDVSEVPARSGKARPNLQKQPLPPQGAAVLWERFLPRRTLKVLLVETDDSTRHVVSALLRNCSYEVSAVSNGIQAWHILRDLTNHIDLVLTEVVMSGLSGIGLLFKIMNHKTCKNIPVIMMSSYDSMGIVFKCLSTGAVDFLVKPIRKNELKNLWQHVWRRCHSSSGSGSESGVQTLKSAKSKSAEEYGNNSGSNDGDDNARDGSDDGSGTQSSWTKRAMDVDSPQATSPWDHPDSTCAQVIHPKPEALGNELVSAVAEKNECPENDGKLLDLEIGVPRNVQGYESVKVFTDLLGAKHDKMPELIPEKDNEQLDGLLEFNCEKPISELGAQFAERTGFATNCTNSRAETKASEAPDGPSKVSEFEDKTTSGPKELPSLEISLKRLIGVGDVDTTAHGDRNILRHSDLSAFSRYNTASITNQAPTGNVGSCSPLDNSSEAMKTESMYNQQSNESSNNNDMGSTNKNVMSKPTVLNEKSTSTSTARYLQPSAFRPVQNGRVVMPQKVDHVVVNASVTEPRDAHQQLQVQHHHHHYHHHHHHVHSMQQKQSAPNQDDLSLNKTAATLQCGPSNLFGGPVEGNSGNYNLNGSASGSNQGSSHHHHHVHNMQQKQSAPDQDELSLSMTAAALQCGPSNMFGGPVEGSSGNYSLNGSASGSNQGSNRQNASSKDVNIGGTNTENDVGLTGKSGVGGASGSGSGSGVDQQNQTSQRVAALTKFRQKRKERCFEKKVRYQSRKRLAEQRPRVRGQFVRQRVYENTDQEADC